MGALVKHFDKIRQATGAHVMVVHHSGKDAARGARGHSLLRAATEGQFVAYYRVSTKRQGQSGLGLAAQREAVERHLDGGAWQLVGEFVEVESGKRHAKLSEELRLCRLRNATMIIAKLDRLARNVAFISGLMEAGVDFVAVDFPTANRLTVHILSSVAEHEATMISARTKAALQAAKSRGVFLGGNRGNLPAVAKEGARASAAARKRKSAELQQDLRPVIEDIAKAGAASLREIALEFNVRGIPAARGGMWSAAQVRRVMSNAPAART